MRATNVLLTDDKYQVISRDLHVQLQGIAAFTAILRTSRPAVEAGADFAGLAESLGNERRQTSPLAAFA